MIYLLIILSVIFLSAAIAGFSSAPWVPTRRKDVDRFLRIADIKEGDVVKRGQLIGYMGNSGRSAGSHLHYEVLYNGKQVNPIGFFQVELNPEAYEKMLLLAKDNAAPMD